MYKIKKLVLTGGPCGGKSECIPLLKDYLENQNWKVIVIPETPTELVLRGIDRGSCSSVYQYQLFQMKLHQAYEDVFMEAAKDIAINTDVVIICDRGQFDCLAYMSEEEFDSVLSEIGVDKVKLFRSYDLVVHLETLAKTSIELYNQFKSSNPARIEDAYDAINADRKIQNIWKSHPNFHIIHGNESMDDKITELINLVQQKLLG